jgi:hypothetical protein
MILSNASSPPSFMQRYTIRIIVAVNTVAMLLPAGIFPADMK